MQNQFVVNFKRVRSVCQSGVTCMANQR